MVENKQTNKRDNLTKYLSLILRHKPSAAKIHLNEYGWAKVPELITGMNKNNKFFHISLPELEEIVKSNTGFEFNEDKSLVRAKGGHSFPIKLNFEEIEDKVQDILFYTEGKFENIEKYGISSRTESYIFLSKTYKEAFKKYAKEIILLDSKKMFEDGIKFYKKDSYIVTNNISADNVKKYCISKIIL